jgi:hypothetical protein
LAGAIFGADLIVDIAESFFNKKPEKLCNNNSVNNTLERSNS